MFLKGKFKKLASTSATFLCCASKELSEGNTDTNPYAKSCCPSLNKDVSMIDK